MKRKQYFEILPSELKIVGLDTEDDFHHPLWQKRALREIPEDQVATLIEGPAQNVIHALKGSKQVISGRQTTKAARAANEARANKGLDPFPVKVIFHDATPEEAMKDMITENALRTDQTPLEKAFDAQRYLALLIEEGKDEKEAMKLTSFAFGCCTQRVKDYLKFLEFEKPVRKAVEKGQLSLDSALKTFRKIPPEEQKEKLQEVLAAAPAPQAGKAPKKPRKKRNTHKQYLEFIAEDPETPLAQGYVLMIQLYLGKATKAECQRIIPNLEKALARAKRQLSE